MINVSYIHSTEALSFRVINLQQEKYIKFKKVIFLTTMHYFYNFFETTLIIYKFVKLKYITDFFI